MTSDTSCNNRLKHLIDQKKVFRPIEMEFLKVQGKTPVTSQG